MILGTVSHGTLKDTDLFIAFRNELYNEHGYDVTEFEQNALEEFLSSGEPDLSEIINDMIDVLSYEFTPIYCYFGAHEGDGSDFGYWIDEEAIREEKGFGGLGTGQELPKEDQYHLFREFLVENGDRWKEVWRV
jgi:hypothetical protein